ncbi:MAG TPA: murein biosynthesis integral membrane protein MurJ [Thermoanaerobaculia bacterium]|nr:murein biosynthesis integral membrane protein MurJ [Thermoanaerobaculia bacterium]
MSEVNSRPRAGFAVLVAAGIFLSRVAGLVRERVFAHYLGNSAAAGAFKAALKIPNFLQNLFGEGVLSASFIPVYARLLAEDDEEMAGRVAGVIFALLAVVVGAIVLVCVLITPWIIDLIAPGFHGDVRLLTIRIVQILFPATGLLVFSAWCLGVLNSHRKFFLSYVAPVFWNAAMIATLIYFGTRTTQPKLAIALAWGTVAGSALQFGIQVPFVWRYAPRIRLALTTALAPVREVIRAFFPVVIGRGVVQLSGYIDQVIASYLGTAAVSGLAYAQTIYFLPISLFGMSVAAAELPQMSGTLGSDEEIHATLRKRLERGLRQIAFFVVPSVIAFIFIGRVLVAALYETGQFRGEDTLYVWYILIGSTVGLLAVTLGRLYSSAFYALRDPKTPLRFAVVRVSLTAVLGVLFAFPLRPYIIDAIRLLHLRVPQLTEGESLFGAIGLTASAGMAGWIEFALLRRALARRIGAVRLAPSFLGRLWASAVAAALVANAFNLWIGPHNHILQAMLVAGVFGAVYFGAAIAVGLPEAMATLSRFRRR